MNASSQPSPGSGGPQPGGLRFRLPAVVMWTCVVLIGIHVLRDLLTVRSDIELYATLAFVPRRFLMALEGSWGAQALLGVTGLVSHALLHASWTHIIVNLGFLAGFGADCARRLGVVRFCLFMVLGALAGGLGHFAVGPTAVAPMAGASDIFSAFMGAFVRYGFRTRASLTLADFDEEGKLSPRASSLMVTLRNQKALGFIGVIAIVNLAMVLGGPALVGEGPPVAWGAHLGGFLAGLLFFALFEPTRRPARLPVTMPANDP